MVGSVTGQKKWLIEINARYVMNCISLTNGNAKNIACQCQYQRAISNYFDIEKVSCANYHLKFLDSIMKYYTT